nr:C2H2 type zinc finger protein [Mimivirus sp.]
MNYIFKHPKYKEIIIYTKKESDLITKEFGKIARDYTGHIKEISDKLKCFENQHNIMKLEYEKEIANREKEIANREKEIANREKKIANKEKDIMQLEKENSDLKYQNEIIELKYKNKLLEKDKKIAKLEKNIKKSGSK